MEMRSGLLAIVFLSMISASSRAAEPAGGEAILAKNCGRCHAIDRTSSSPFAPAPPLRDAYKKFSVEELKMRLSEGVVSHFKDMPQIDFTDEQVAAIVDYLGTLNSPQ